MTNSTQASLETDGRKETVHPSVRPPFDYVTKLSLWGAVASAVALLLFLIGLPYLSLAWLSFYAFDSTTQVTGDQFTLENYIAFFRGASYRASLRRSLQLSLWTTLLCTLLAYPVAYVMARARQRVRTVLFITAVSSLTINVVVRTFAWIIILAGQGPINQSLTALGLSPVKLLFTMNGAMIGLTHVLLPYMILPLYGSIVAIHPSLEEAAMNLGASPFGVFRQIILPLSAPGLIAGITMVFTLAISSYVTPAVLGGGTFPVLTMIAADEILILLNFPRGAAIAIILVGATLATLACSSIAVARISTRRHT